MTSRNDDYGANVGPILRPEVQKPPCDMADEKIIPAGMFPPQSGKQIAEDDPGHEH